LIILFNFNLVSAANEPCRRLAKQIPKQHYRLLAMKINTHKVNLHITSSILYCFLRIYAQLIECIRLSCAIFRKLPINQINFTHN
jgi:hypothetical protein